MPHVEFVNLFVVALIALVAPLLLGLAPALRIPAVVLEIAAGVAIGPAGLGLVEIDLPVQIVSLLGLAMLLFLAGLEIDLRQLRGRLMGVAVLGYVASLALGLTAGWGFHAVGWVNSPALLAVALSATSLGLVVPVLKDAGHVDGALGQTVIAASSVADFAAVVLLSLLFSTSGGSTGDKVVLLTLFVVLVVATGVAGLLAGRSMRLGSVLTRLQDTTAQIRVRAAVALLVALVALAERFGLEGILGAFIAGGLVGLIDRDSTSHPQFRTKLEALGFGFFVPVFFIASGMQLDLGGLLKDWSELAKVPLFLLALLVVRGVPALLYVSRFGPRTSLAAGLLQATSLPFLVAATQIGVVIGLMTAVTATALVAAGLLSVLVFPLSALSILRKQAGAESPG